MKNIELSAMRILIVFPKRSEAVAMKTGLEKLGFTRLDISNSGVGALALLSSTKYDLVITDRELPGGVSGLEMIRRMNVDRVLFTTPTIMITTENRRDKIMEAIYAGVGGYVLRPYTMAVIEGKIKELLTATGAFASKMRKVQEGAELLHKGKVEEAIETFEELVVVEPEAEELYLEGNRSLAEGRYEEAIVFFRRAIEINQLYAEAYRGLGEAYMKKGDTEQAEQYLIKAGQLFIQRNQFNEARETILAALQVNPQSVNPYNTLGIVYRKSGDYHKSIQYYELALKISPYDEKIHYNLAHVFLETDQKKRAIEALEKALALNPEFTEARRFKEHLLTRDSDTDTASSLPIRPITERRYIPLVETGEDLHVVVRATMQKGGGDARIIAFDLRKPVFEGLSKEALAGAWDEVVRAASASNGCIPKFIEAGNEDGIYYSISEWLDGLPLLEGLRQPKNVPLWTLLEVARSTAETLSLMHREGFIHQSLSPLNIIVTRDRRIKIIDFRIYGMETLLRSAVTVEAVVVNPYHSPEHYSESALTPATDVFSLGSIVYEMLTGTKAFTAASPSKLIFGICFGEPAPFVHPNPAFTEATRAFLKTALSKNPADRFPTAKEMEQALASLISLMGEEKRRNAQTFKKQ